MKIPSDEKLIFPLFSILKDMKVYNIEDLSNRLALKLRLSYKDRNKLIQNPIKSSNLAIKSFDQHINLILLKITSLEFAKVVDGSVTFNVNYKTYYKISAKGLEFYEMNRALSEKEFGANFEMTSRKSMEYLFNTNN